MYKLFMEFENPTNAFAGEQTAVQGFAIHGSLGFVLYHTGVCGVYDLVERGSAPLGVFKLGSYNNDKSDPAHINHANDAMFGTTCEGEKFPLLYVTAGNSGVSDENGYVAYCAVEQIRENDGVYSSELVQRIYYKNEGVENTAYSAPAWGWPASLVDVEGGWFYLVGTRYRAKKEFTQPDNVYIITKFRLPKVSEGDVTFHPSDIEDQFELPLTALFTQGGTVRDGKIWYVYGLGNEQYPDAMNVIDLQKKELSLFEDLSHTPFASEEVECCAFLGNKLIINTQAGRLYEKI